LRHGVASVGQQVEDELIGLRLVGANRGQLVFHADIALEKVVDFSQVIVTVSLTHHRKADFDLFEAMIRGMDEVTECVATGGGMDYVMQVYTRNLAAFQDLMETLLAAEIGIDRYMTYIATRRIKSIEPSVAKLIARDGK